MQEPVLLTSLQMAQFAAQGCLRMEAVVPDAINERVIAELESALASSQLDPAEHPDPLAIYGALMQQQALPAVAPGSHWQSAFEQSTALAALLHLPQVQGAIHSLVGPKASVDHHFLHVTFPPSPGHSERAQHYHQDSTIDPRHSFDLQIMYFPHAVSDAMGGTRYLPGSHLRIVSEAAISRYQNILGQEHIACPAGTLLFLHHGIWHGGGANRSDQRRYMWKLRLSPQEPQVRLWNTSDLTADHYRQRPIFWLDPTARLDPVHTALTAAEPWFEADTGRLEFVNRVKFWRRLLGDNRFDADYWVSRLENEFQ